MVIRYVGNNLPGKFSLNAFFPALRFSGFHFYAGNQKAYIRNKCKIYTANLKKI